MRKLRKRNGTRTERTKITERKSGRVVHDDESVHVLPGQSAESAAVVKHQADVRLSLDYHSVGVSVGIEMPMPVEPGDLKAAQKAMRRVETVIDKHLERRANGARKLLKGLTK